MYLRYGNYQHASNEVSYSITRSVSHNADGSAEKETRRWALAGRLHADTPAALTAAFAALDAAYASDGYDIAFYEDNGTKTALFINNADTMNGVQVVSRPECPDGSGGQYTTYLDYRIAIEADLPIYPQSSGIALIISQETLDIQGDGGPAFVIREPLIGTPVPMQVKQRTKVIATQTGYAEAYGNYPFAGVPFAPQWLKRDRSGVRLVPPSRNFAGAASNQKYRIEWNYQFESPEPLNGSSF